MTFPAGTITVDGFDEAIVGFVDGSVQYSVEKAVTILMERDGFTRTEALEWLDHNVVDAHAVEGVPPTWVEEVTT